MFNCDKKRSIVALRWLISVDLTEEKEILRISKQTYETKKGGFWSEAQ